MSEFQQFSEAVHARFLEMSKHELYSVKMTGDELWAAYLAAFPEGTNTIFRQRTEHDCSCCRNFIRNLGPLVTITDGVVDTVWDIDGLPSPYNEVAAVLFNLVMTSPIDSVYRTKLFKFGLAENHEQTANGNILTWNHFHGAVPKKHRTDSPEAAMGDINTTVAMLRRGLQEFTTEAFDTVLDLIGSKSLYRGEENLAAVSAFAALLKTYQKKSPQAQDLYVWELAGHPNARLRNTSMGTLLTDLSTGVELEVAVKKFEDKVSEGKYKRPTAVVTPAMIDQAMKKLDDLGLRPALERRVAVLSDISVNNVIWADSSAQGHMKDHLADMLKGSAKKAKLPDSDHAEPISIEDFMNKVVPTSKGLEVLVRNFHRPNFMTLTAPVHADAERLFKWGNPFAWHYNGGLADSSIRRAVQGKGGRVDGAFRFSQSWNHEKRNASLMDLHVFMPGHGFRDDNPVNDSYGNQERVGWNHRQHVRTGASQDVDYTKEAPVGYVPVENITFPDLSKMPQGRYICKIHNWNLRQPTQGGFKAEIEFGGQLFEYDYDKPLGHKQWITVAVVTLENGQFSIEHKLPCSTSSQQVWGVATEGFVKVDTLMYSPNHWDGEKTGNRHWFFMLNGCRSDEESVRGFYNEYLRGDLEQHRKVFELIGSKTQFKPAGEQLSGLGFSSTRNEQLIVRAQGSQATKLYNIQF